MRILTETKLTRLIIWACLAFGLVSCLDGTNQLDANGTGTSSGGGGTNNESRPAVSPETSFTTVGGQTVTLTCTGGLPPYNWSRLAGYGTLVGANTTAVLTTHSEIDGVVVIRCEDQNGRGANATVFVKALPTVPGAIGMLHVENKTIPYSGGVGPMTFEVTSGNATISDGIVTSHTTYDVTVYTMTDSLGNVATGRVYTITDQAGNDLENWIHPESTGLSGLANGAAVGGGSAVWTDMTGNGNNFVQATEDDQPTYDTTTTLNGYPSINFGANDSLASENEYNSSANVSMFLVGYSKENAASQALFNDGGTGSRLMYFRCNSDTTVARSTDADGDSVTSGSAGCTSARIFAWVVNAGSNMMTASNNGAATPQTNIFWDNTNYTDGTAPTLSNSSGGSYMWEYLYYDVNLSNDNRQLIECYLSNKYGITVAQTCT